MSQHMSVTEEPNPTSVEPVHQEVLVIEYIVMQVIWSSIKIWAGSLETTSVDLYLHV